MDRGQWLVDGLLSGWNAGQGEPRRDRSRPASVRHEPGRPWRLGEQQGARASEHRLVARGSARRTDRARPRWRAVRNASRRSDARRSGARTCNHRGRMGAGHLERAGAAARARDHRLAGRDRPPAHPERLPDACRTRRVDDEGGGEPSLGPYSGRGADRRAACDARAGEPRGLRIRGAKIFQDGVLENFTGALLEPYVDTDNRGIGMHEPDELSSIVTLLDGHGFQVHLHTIGDRAVRESLDAIEAARKANGRRDARHHLAHIQLVHPDDQPRFAELAVVANAQPYWAATSRYVTDLTLPFIGEERASYHYPFGSLHRAGARLAFGSDWTVSTPNPLELVEVAVTRVEHPNRDPQPMLPDEALDLETAVAASTRGSAYVNFLEDETGSIEPGKFADLVVLDRDLFDPGAGPVGDARVLLTLVEGEVVFDAL